MKTRLVNLLKIAVGLGLLAYLYWRLEDPQALWQQIAGADTQKLLAAGLFYAAAVFVSTVKWAILLRARGVTLPFRAIVSYQWMGEFFNFALPTGVGGDLMRGYGLARDTQRKADAAVSVLIDRFLGLTIFMVCAAAASVVVLAVGRQTNGDPFTPESQLYLRFLSGASLLGAIALLGMLAMTLSRRLKVWVEVLLGMLPFSNRTLPLWRHLARAFNAYRGQQRAMALSALGSVLILLLTSMTIWLIAEAIQPNSIPFGYVFTMNPIIGFALLVPITPGGAGIRQVSFVALFGLVGVNERLAFAVGLLQHATGLLVSLPGIYLWALGRARRAATVAAAKPAPPVGLDSEIHSPSPR